MTATHPPAASTAVIRFREARVAGPAGSIDCGDWEIAAGEAWLVAGGWGTGKTMLLRAIAGLESLRDGRIERFGADWTEFSEAETLQQRRRIGVVLAREAGLFHRATVLDNVRLPLLYHADDSSAEVIAERVQALLAALELERHAHLPSVRAGPSVARHTLLARSLALAPDLLLLDDPCAGLDGWERRRLVQLIARLNAGHELNEGRPLTVVVAGGSPADWREFPGLKCAHLRDRALVPVGGWEQLVASAPELFHADGVEASPD